MKAIFALTLLVNVITLVITLAAAIERPIMSYQPESGVKAVMAITRTRLTASSGWSLVPVSESYRNGSFGSMAAIGSAVAPDAL